MLMPHATDLLAGRAIDLQDEARRAPRSHRMPQSRRRRGLVSHLSDLTTRLLSLVL